MRRVRRSPRTTGRYRRGSTPWARCVRYRVAAAPCRDRRRGGLRRRGTRRSGAATPTFARPSSGTAPTSRPPVLPAYPHWPRPTRRRAPAKRATSRFDRRRPCWPRLPLPPPSSPGTGRSARGQTRGSRSGARRGHALAIASAAIIRASPSSPTARSAPTIRYSASGGISFQPDACMPIAASTTTVPG